MTDEELLQKRLQELAQRSYHSGQYTFTDFLSSSGQDLFYRMERDLSYACPAVWGGTKDCERVMVGFGSEELCGYAQPFPIACLLIVPVSERYGEELSHRDYLGAAMNLGIERELLGDIVICDKRAYLFCVERIAPYLSQELRRIRHTQVTCVRAEDIPPSAVTRREPRNCSVASLRCDSVVSAVCRISRSQAQELFRRKKVFVDGRLVENVSAQLSPGCLVSVRGYGKFRYLATARETRKGKLAIEVEWYVS